MSGGRRVNKPMVPDDEDRDHSKNVGLFTVLPPDVSAILRKFYWIQLP